MLAWWDWFFTLSSTLVCNAAVSAKRKQPGRLTSPSSVSMLCSPSPLFRCCATWRENKQTSKLPAQVHHHTHRENTTEEWQRGRGASCGCIFKPWKRLKTAKCGIFKKLVTYNGNTTNLNKDLKIISNRKHGARKTERGEEKPPPLPLQDPQARGRGH